MPVDYGRSYHNLVMKPLGALESPESSRGLTTEVYIGFRWLDFDNFDDYPIVSIV